MTAMDFVLAKEVITRLYDDKPEVTREFDVFDGGIHSETIAHGTRTRRFLIERVILHWWTSPHNGRDYSSISATGRTVLANGEISTRSTGYATYWHEGPPADIAALAEQQSKAVESLRMGGAR